MNRTSSVDSFSTHRELASAGAEAKRNVLNLCNSNKVYRLFISIEEAFRDHLALTKVGLKEENVGRYSVLFKTLEEVYMTINWKTVVALFNDKNRRLKAIDNGKPFFNEEMAKHTVVDFFPFKSVFSQPLKLIFNLEKACSFSEINNPFMKIYNACCSFEHKSTIAKITALVLRYNISKGNISFDQKFTAYSIYSRMQWVTVASFAQKSRVKRSQPSSTVKLESSASVKETKKRAKIDSGATASLPQEPMRARPLRSNAKIEDSGKDLEFQRAQAQRSPHSQAEQEPALNPNQSTPLPSCTPFSQPPVFTPLSINPMSQESVTVFVAPAIEKRAASLFFVESEDEGTEAEGSENENEDAGGIHFSNKQLKWVFTDNEDENDWLQEDES